MSKIGKKALVWMLCVVLMVAMNMPMVSAAEDKKVDETPFGDANLNGYVDMGDAVLISRFAAEDAEAKISAQGQINADVTHDGNIKEDDAMLIRKYLAYLLTSDELTDRVTGGNAGGENADVKFSFVSDNNESTVHVTSGTGKTLRVPVLIDAGENAITALDVQFHCSDGIRITAIERDMSNEAAFIYRGPMIVNTELLRANTFTKSISSSGDNDGVVPNKGKAVFFLTVEVPETTEPGTYTVGFSSECRVYKGCSGEIYSTTFTPLTVVVERSVWGDANLDGHVDVLDASYILKDYAMHASATGTFLTEPQQTINADVDKDGKVDSADASYVAEYLVGLTLPDKVSPKGTPPELITVGKDGGNNPNILFSLVDNQQADTITIEYGKNATIDISVQLYSGQVDISCMNVQFLGSKGITITSGAKGIILNTSATGRFRNYSHTWNPDNLRVAVYCSESYSFSAENGEPVFTMQVSVPDNLPEGTYTVGFSDECRVHIGLTENIYSTAFTPYTIVVKKKQEATPEAVFTATGSDTATLTNVAAGMTYSIDGGAAAEITGDTVELTNLEECTISVIQPSKSAVTADSDAQNITVTKAAKPDLKATQPATINEKGSIPTTTSHQKSTDGINWTNCDGAWENLDEGTYYVRVAPSGTSLASDAQEISITTKRYTVSFVDEDGTELQSGPVAAGETPAYTGETPVKAPTVEKLRTFAGWTLPNSSEIFKTLPAVTDEATYVAAYTESDRDYTDPVWVWTGYTEAKATFTAVDDAAFTQEVTATDDAITNVVTGQPTCTGKGERTYTATITFLGGQYTDTVTEEIAPIAHTFNQEVVNAKYLKSEATCTTAAVYYKSCVCGEKGTETFESGKPLGHDYREVAGTAKAATCKEAGKEADKKCTRCGDVITGAEIAKTTVHQWKAATGYAPKTCEICGLQEGDVIRYLPAEGNTIEHVKGSTESKTVTYHRSENDNDCISHYRMILIDGEEKALPAKSGSTIITFDADTLNLLSVGTHIVTVVFDDWKDELTLVIKEAEAPAPVEPEPTPTVAPAVKPVDTPTTGDSEMMTIWILLAIVAAGSIGGLAAMKKQKRA
ncbi:MAG: dockerin type I repeat-containing protein [Lachnospiraceae bacterium]|nr:dockerin type I repeat-containing protein [Lachnospiraceae bacterium]